MRRFSATSRLITTAAAVLLLLAATIPAASAAPPAGHARYGEAAGKVAGAGTRGKVNAAEVARRKPGLQRPTSTLNLPRPGVVPAGGNRVAAPRSTTIAAPVEVTPTANPPIGQPGFAGLSQQSGPVTNVEPPDPWVAAGPDHILQATNLSLRATDRTGSGSISVPLASFFDLPAGFENSDPRVFYDSAHGRWIVTEISWICQASDGHAYGYVDMLVSDTADPLGNFTLWYWWWRDLLPDYSALGSSSDKLAWGINLFKMPTGFATDCMSQPGADYDGPDILVFDWADVVAHGGSNGRLDFDDLAGPANFSTPRIGLQAPATSPAMDVILQYTEDGITFSPYYLRVTGSAVAQSVDIPIEFNLTTVGVADAWVEPPPPQQPGPDTVTEAIDSRPTDAIQQGNRLVFVSTHGCTPATDTDVHDCVRVTELNTQGVGVATPPSLAQDFLIADVGRDNYFGGVGLAGTGDLHVVWTASSTTAGDYPSSYAAYQLTGEAPNNLSAPELLKAGTGVYPGGRWGDYNGVAQDPQVPNAVWQANEYSGGANGWQTWVSQLQTGGSSYTPITPVRVLDSRPAYNIGLSGTFAANVPRTWDVAGFEVLGTPVIPDDAIAVTGNFVVANQTAAGYAAITPTPNANPPTSSLNFPLGDTRANNVTIPLSSTGTLSAVFKAPGGKTTHFIFDVTGYFTAGDTEATYATVTPVRVLDSRAAFSIGLTGRFVANTPRTLSIAGDNGIPADAVAVTANLAVVGQTRAGYVAVTPDPDPNPPTATMNFPLGDVRANGLTARLNGDGDLSLVYKASGGTTDLVMDITGYYRNDPGGLLFFPLTPGRIMETRPGFVLSRLTGPFTASVPRTLSANGHFGIPNTGVGAITGNLSIVGQTAAGYAVITPEPNPNPPTATINFPLGDVRGNGVTVPLNGSFDLSFVYKAKAGAKTHMILDVTGYFR